jgi:hypothetical protein
VRSRCVVRVFHVSLISTRELTACDSRALHAHDKAAVVGVPPANDHRAMFHQYPDTSAKLSSWLRGTLTSRQSRLHLGSCKVHSKPSRVRDA